MTDQKGRPYATDRFLDQPTGQIRRPTNSPTACYRNRPELLIYRHDPLIMEAHLRSDLKCPGCFVTGAEVVRGSGSSVTGAQTRQAYFSFTTPGHGLMCEYGSTETANSIPETLMKFGESKSALTLVVKDLVCT